MQISTSAFHTKIAVTGRIENTTAMEKLYLVSICKGFPFRRNKQIRLKQETAFWNGSDEQNKL